MRVRCLAEARHLEDPGGPGRVGGRGVAWPRLRPRPRLPACFVHALDWMGGGLGRVWCLNGDGLLLPSIFLPPVCFLRTFEKAIWLAGCILVSGGHL